MKRIFFLADCSVKARLAAFGVCRSVVRKEILPCKPLECNYLCRYHVPRYDFTMVVSRVKSHMMITLFNNPLAQLFGLFAMWSFTRIVWAQSMHLPQALNSITFSTF